MTGSRQACRISDPPRDSPRTVDQDGSGTVQVRRLFLFRVCTAILSCALLVSCGEAQVTKPKSIKVVGDITYAPYEYSEDGVSKGLLVDLWKKWSEKTGIPAEYVLYDWEVAQQKVKSGEADAVGGMMKDEGREKDFDFIRPVMGLDEYVYYRESKFKGSNFATFADLAPYVVGVVIADEAERKFRSEVPAALIKTYSTYKTVVESAIRGDVDIFLMEQPVARYWLDRYDKNRAFVRSASRLFWQPQYVAVRKGNKDLERLINDGFDRLTTQDVVEIRDKWEGYKLNVTEEGVLERLSRNLQRYPLALLLLVYAIAMLTLWLFMLWKAPRFLLDVNQRLRRLELPPLEFGSVKGITSSTIRWALLVTPFEFHPRVVDDWLRSRGDQIGTAFRNLQTVRSRSRFYAVQMAIDGTEIDDANSKDREERITKQVGRILKANRTLLIVGEGGLGKTSLACWLALQSLESSLSEEADEHKERIFAHPILPVLFDADLAPAEDVKETLRSKVSDLLGTQVLEVTLLRLLALNRVLVIIDGLTEKDAPTQAKFRSLSPEMRFRRLLVTARSREIPLGTPVAVVEPHRLKGTAIANFLSTYVKNSAITDEEFYAACTRISVLIRRAHVTPLFVALYGQMLTDRNKEDVLNAPMAIPDLVSAYVDKLNRQVRFGQRPILEVLKWAKAVAWICLQPDFIPAEVKAETLLAGVPAARVPLTSDAIGYLQEIGLVVNTRVDRFKISQDPLAEYLAAMFLLDQVLHGTRQNPIKVQKEQVLPPLWGTLSKQVNKPDAHSSAPLGFIRALIDAAAVMGSGENRQVKQDLEAWTALVQPDDGRDASPASSPSHLELERAPLQQS